jgi:Flp pilus assembly protein TadG
MTIIDSEVANDLHFTANAAVPAGFAGLPAAERFISNLEINKTVSTHPERPAIIGNGKAFRSRTAFPRRKDRKGAMLVLVVVTLVVLLAAAALSVDIAYMHLVREELHIATDAAAKAAVTGLAQGGTSEIATNQAIAYAAKNTVAGAPLRIAASNVQLGKVAYVSNSRWNFNKNQTPLTAACVTVTMDANSTPGAVGLFFGRLFGTSTFSPTMTSTAAFVRNKVCLCFDRSRSMTFDTTGNNESWPTSESGFPYGVPSSASAVKIKIGTRTYTYDYRWLYPPCTNSRWNYLSIAANAFLDALQKSTVATPVALVTWASASDNSSSRDALGQYHTYTGGTLTSSNSIANFGAYTVETSDPIFPTTYPSIRTAVANKSSVTMLGGTDMNTGLQQAVDLFATTDDGLPWNKTIILFSDGCYNIGSNPVTNAAANAAKAGIVVHTVGFLLNAQDSANGEATLQAIADATGGRHYRATDGASLKAAFEELARTLPVILTQ